MVEPTIKLGNPDGEITATIRGPTARSILVDIFPGVLDTLKHPALDPSLRLYVVKKESRILTPDITLPLPAGTQIIVKP